MITARNPWNRGGFSTIELLMVMGIILLLTGLVSVSMVNMLTTARADNALSQISATFQAAHRGALALNQERRVVLETVYPDLEANTPPRQFYERGVRTEFWVEKKINQATPWNSNFSAPLNDVQILPSGVLLIDFDANILVPFDQPSLGKDNGDGTRSLYWSFVYSGDGRITEIRRSGRNPNEPEVNFPVQRNIALHFMYNGTLIDMGDSQPPRAGLEYPDLLATDPNAAAVIAEFQNEVDHEYRARSQIQTLYLLRLTGLVAAYNYGIFSPWPKRPLPDQFQEAI